MVIKDKASTSLSGKWISGLCGHPGSIGLSNYGVLILRFQAGNMRVSLIIDNSGNSSNMPAA
jgi:hypothetical protein